LGEGAVPDEAQWRRPVTPHPTLSPEEGKARRKAPIALLRFLALGLTCTTLAACTALRQPGSIENANAAPICLPSYNIDHTDIPNDSTIMFYMRDRTVWKNTLAQPCFGLRLDTRGFTYEPTDPGSDTICSNLVIVHTNTDHNVCSLGEFTKVSGPASKPS
jgi:hypothetical protein